TWATKLSVAMQNQWELEDVNTDQQDHGLEAFVTIDPDKAAGLGLTNTQIDNTLYDAFGQRDVSTIYQDVNQYHVVMEVAPQFSQDPTVLKNIYVSSGRAAPASGAPAANGQTPIGVPSPAANVTPLTTAAGNSSRGLVTAPPVNQTPATKALATGTGGTGVVGGVTSPGQATAGATITGPGAPPARAASTGVAVSGAAAALVPLSAFAKWADSSTPTRVNHQDTQPATTISFNLAEGKSLSDATAAITR